MSPADVHEKSIRGRTPAMRTPALRLKGLVASLRPSGAALIIGCATVTASFAVSASIAHADTAYQWRDNEGRQHFGSKPPKGAIDVRPIAGKSFSRYSSSKLLRPYARSSFAPITEEPIAPPQRVAKKKPPSSRIKDGEALVLEPEAPPEGADLAQGPVDVQWGPAGEVTACAVTVKNTTIIPARNVIVTFEFQDGTLIPASGPELIEGDTQATYSIPKELLPLKLKLDPSQPAAAPLVTVRAEG